MLKVTGDPAVKESAQKEKHSNRRRSNSREPEGNSEEGTLKRLCKKDKTQESWSQVFIPPSAFNAKESLFDMKKCITGNATDNMRCHG